MAFFVYRFQFLIDHLGIQLCGRDITVTHQLLNGVQIRTVFQKMHRKTVAQSMGCDLFIDMGFALVILHDFPEALTAHTDTADVHKQRIFRRIRYQGITHVLQICCQRTQRCRIQRNCSGLFRTAAFDAALNETAAQMYAQLGGFSSGADAIAKVALAFDAYMEGLTTEDLLYCYENHMPDKVSDKSHQEVLDMLGVKETADPDFIYIYPIDFEKKENIASMIEAYNSSAAEDDQIQYTDIAAMLMSSVSNIITAISVVLI